MTDNEMIEKWYDSMRFANLSPATLRRRELTFRRFAPGRDLATTTADDIRRWLTSLPGISSQTLGMYLGDIRVFYKWAVVEDLIAVNPCDKITSPKRPKYVPRPIPTHHLRTAIDRAPPRMRIMLILAGYSGLRCAEIADLKCEDFDHEANKIRVRGKGRKVRIVTMHQQVRDLVQPGTKGPVVGWHGKHVTPRSVSNAISAYLRGLGIDYTGHQARHSYGTRLYAATKDINAVRAEMGHESILTTQGYVQHSDGVVAAALLEME